MGYLEALWHFAGRYTPQGDIGKYSDAEIEAWIEWRGSPGQLIASIALSGWIDFSSTHRLLVHDWHDHADDATRLALKRKKLDFLSRCPDSVPTVSGLPVPEPVPEPESNTSLPAFAGVVGVENGNGHGAKKIKRICPLSSSQIPKFEEWYKIYPRHLGRDDAEMAFAKRVDDDLFPIVMDALRAQLPKFLKLKSEGRGDKFPHPASWLNQRRWLDEIETDEPLFSGPHPGLM